MLSRLTTGLEATLFRGVFHLCLATGARGLRARRLGATQRCNGDWWFLRGHFNSGRTVCCTDKYERCRSVEKGKLYPEVVPDLLGAGSIWLHLAPSGSMLDSKTLSKCFRPRHGSPCRASRVLFFFPFRARSELEKNCCSPLSCILPRPFFVFLCLFVRLRTPRFVCTHAFVLA